MGYKDWQGFHKPEINQTNLIRTSITGLDWKTTGMNFSREAAWISINWFRILQYTSTKLRTNLIFTVSGLLNNLILNQLLASGQPPKKKSWNRIRNRFRGTDPRIRIRTKLKRYLHYGNWKTIQNQKVQNMFTFCFQELQNLNFQKLFRVVNIVNFL